MKAGSRNRLPLKCVFVTGTDTDVGKTVVSAGLAESLKRDHRDIGVMKPLATGCAYRKGKLVSSDVEALMCLSGTSDTVTQVNPYAFKDPVAPYTASRLTGKPIPLRTLRSKIELMRSRHEYTIIEGIGGLCVPITSSRLILDLIKDLRMSVLIVSRPVLGTLNHTILTVEAALAHQLDICGVVLNCTDQRGSASTIRNNTEDLRRILPVEILASIPYLGRDPFRATHRKRVRTFAPLRDRIFGK